MKKQLLLTLFLSVLTLNSSLSFAKEKYLPESSNIFLPDAPIVRNLPPPKYERDPYQKKTATLLHALQSRLTEGQSNRLDNLILLYMASFRHAFEQTFAVEIRVLDHSNNFENLVALFPRSSYWDSGYSYDRGVLEKALTPTGERVNLRRIWARATGEMILSLAGDPRVKDVSLNPDPNFQIESRRYKDDQTLRFPEELRSQDLQADERDSLFTNHLTDACVRFFLY